MQREIDQSGCKDDGTITSKESSDELTAEEIQSVTTALGLLRNLVVGGNDSGCKYTNVKTSDWDTLELGLEDLEVLECCHEDKSISVMAGKLRELISVNIAVMDFNYNLTATLILM